ncbi:MAG: cytochrome C [Ignavibacteria bacterium]|nr:MAG: cytochrome C [Ignavibacteria bacterium]
MKTLWKILMGLVGIVVVMVIGGILYLNSAFPDVGDAEDITVEATPERIERGRYLALHVSMCIDCHSERDWKRYAGPVVPGSEGHGGELFGEDMGLPGSFYAANLTPYHLGGWTDGELFRAITTGVSRDGRPLFPIMPYQLYGKMTREDIYSIIAYLRSLPVIEHDTPESNAGFPMNFIMRTIPVRASFADAIPDPSDRLAYGKYMTEAAGCMECHTTRDHGEPIEGMDYAGGMEFPLPAGIVRAQNITPDLETGIGAWTEEMFVQRFRSYADSVFVDATLGTSDFNTVMPWRMYAGMKDQDLRAIFTYLNEEVRPVRNRVERFTPVSR